MVILERIKVCFYYTIILLRWLFKKKNGVSVCQKPLRGSCSCERWTEIGHWNVLYNSWQDFWSTEDQDVIDDEIRELRWTSCLKSSFGFLSIFTGWQLGWDHHSHHGHLGAQPLSGGHRSHYKGSGGQCGARLPPLLHPDPGNNLRPAGVSHATGLSGATPYPLARQAAELWDGLRGPLHLCGLQTAHTAAGCLGALLQASAGRTPKGLCIPGTTCCTGSALCDLLLALLWSQDTRLTGELREGKTVRVNENSLSTTHTYAQKQRFQ